jgi:hypothetical protein
MSWFKDLHEYLKEAVIKKYIPGPLGFLFILSGILEVFLGIKITNWLPFPGMLLVGIFLLLVSSFLVYRDQKLIIRKYEQKEKDLTPVITTRDVHVTTRAPQWKDYLPENTWDVDIDIDIILNCKGRPGNFAITLVNLQSNEYLFKSSYEEIYPMWDPDGRRRTFYNTTVSVDPLIAFPNAVILIGLPFNFGTLDNYIQALLSGIRKEIEITLEFSLQPLDANDPAIKYEHIKIELAKLIEYTIAKWREVSFEGKSNPYYSRIEAGLNCLESAYATYKDDREPGIN